MPTPTAKPLQAVPEPSSLQAASRCLWNGSLSVGLLTVPVKLHAATGEQNVPLHQTHKACNRRISMKKSCTGCGAEVPAADVGKGYEMTDGTIIPLTDEEATASMNAGHEIAVDSFCPAAAVDPVMLGKPYYLVPGTAGGKAYALLAATLARTGKAAITRITLRKAESMAVITAAGPDFSMLVLQLLTWMDEVRMAPALPASEPVKPADLKMATALVNSMTEDWDPARYHSASRAALNDVIERKVAASTSPATHSSGGTKKIPDLASTLRASLAASKENREAKTA
jgi:DNA end-binding protein Ku